MKSKLIFIFFLHLFIENIFASSPLSTPADNPLTSSSNTPLSHLEQDDSQPLLYEEISNATSTATSQLTSPSNLSAPIPSENSAFARTTSASSFTLQLRALEERKYSPTHRRNSSASLSDISTTSTIQRSQSAEDFRKHCKTYAIVPYSESRVSANSGNTTNSRSDRRQNSDALPAEDRTSLLRSPNDDGDKSTSSGSSSSNSVSSSVMLPFELQSEHNSAEADASSSRPSRSSSESSLADISSYRAVSLDYDNAIEGLLNNFSSILDAQSKLHLQNQPVEARKKPVPSFGYREKQFLTTGCFVSAAYYGAKFVDTMSKSNTRYIDPASAVAATSTFGTAVLYIGAVAYLITKAETMFSAPARAESIVVKGQMTNLERDLRRSLEDVRLNLLGKIDDLDKKNIEKFTKIRALIKEGHDTTRHLHEEIERNQTTIHQALDQEHHNLDQMKTLMSSLQTDHVQMMLKISEIGLKMKEILALAHGLAEIERISHDDYEPTLSVLHSIHIPRTLGGVITGLGKQDTDETEVRERELSLRNRLLARRAQKAKVIANAPKTPIDCTEHKDDDDYDDDDNSSDDVPVVDRDKDIHGFTEPKTPMQRLFEYVNLLRSK